MSTKKKKFVKHNPNLPPLAQAAHVGLLVLSTTGCNTWATLVESKGTWGRVTLTVEQQQLIDDHSYVLQHLRIAPLRTIDMCDTCGRWVLGTSKRIGKKCSFSIGCDGEVVHVSKMAHRETLVRKMGETP